MKKMEKPIIENTEMFECIDETTGKLQHYHIYPADGYKIHEKSRDEMEETGETKLGFTKGVVTALANYDFESNPRQIYAQLESEIPDPDNQIHGDDEPDHEVASTEPDAEPEPITE